jgi:hypothetical protein
MNEFIVRILYIGFSKDRGGEKFEDETALS